jgi:hypothetical protein
MAPHIKDQIISFPIPLASWLSLDPEFKRMGAARPTLPEDAKPGEIGRWLDDGAPSPV